MTYRQRLAEHLRVLLVIQGYRKQDVAFALGYSAAWTSKILKDERPISTDDLPKVAAFFGLTVDEFISPGISTLTERRQLPRRKVGDRRRSPDRRRIDTRAFPIEQRRALLADRTAPPVSPYSPEWTPAQREAAAVKMKGDPSSELPSRHGEYFRSPGARQRRPAREATRQIAGGARRAK